VRPDQALNSRSGSAEEDDAETKPRASSGVELHQEAVVEPERIQFPLPHSYQSFLLTGIFGFLFLYFLYFTRDIAVPVVFAFILNLALQPPMRALTDLRIPRLLAALIVIGGFLTCVAGLGISLAAPAADWMSKAPESISRVEDRLSFLKNHISKLQDTLHQIERLADGMAQGVPAVVVEGPGLSSSLFTGTSSVIAAIGTTVFLLFFLLAAGDMMLRRFVEILPTLSDKKQAVDISREIEHQVSVYLGTVGIINAAVGTATGLAAYLCGLPDPILWGTMACLLNFIPILGPLAGIVIFLLVGLLSFDSFWQAALPAGIYLLIHLVEGELFTPMLMARRFVLNPVLVIMSLIFWYWMWGLAGALLAVPMVAILKIICDRVNSLTALGHFLGGIARR
jgi:predicted PurR-regulated permease PerM